MPAIYSLWIVGRNGGLLYSRVRTAARAGHAEARSAFHCHLLETLPHPRLLSSLPWLVPPCAKPQDFLQLPPIEFNDKLRLASSW